MKLHELRDNPGRNEKGQARRPWPGLGQPGQDGVARGHQGSEIPVGRLRSAPTRVARCRLYQRLPKRGFNKPNRKEFRRGQPSA